MEKTKQPRILAFSIRTAAATAPKASKIGPRRPKTPPRGLQDGLKRASKQHKRAPSRSERFSREPEG
eukprot:382973-Pyramimonas_sp.AAC.1